MNVVANGKARAVADNATVADVIVAFDLKAEWVVVEHNGEALERARFNSVRLRDGDRLEIVHAVAGG